jgi:hypothetical protein
MKKVYPLLAAAVFAGGITTAAFAESPETGATGSSSHQTGEGSSMPGSSTPGSSMSEGSSMPGSSMPGSSMSGKFQGEHTMNGTISKIDRTKGTLSLQSDTETLDLHFPPEAIKDFSEGDEVSVHLGISKKDKLTSQKM